MMGFLQIWIITHLPCDAQSDPATQGMNNYEMVSFPGKVTNQEIRGYFVHGTNGATIIIPPTGGSGLGYWRKEAVILNENGYNLLNYESRNCLGLTHSLGYNEVNEVGDALDYLAARNDVDITRIGISGFSTGGATSIMAAARYPQIRAVIAEGGYYDFHELIGDETERYWFGGFFAFGANLSYQLALGMPMTVLSPVSVIGQIAPRPLLLIYGSREPSLPGARKQLAAAGENAELWEVPEGTHGSYWIHAPQDYERRVITFFDLALDVTR